jgi:hypothetical protein
VAVSAAPALGLDPAEPLRAAGAGRLLRLIEPASLIGVLALALYLRWSHLFGVMRVDSFNYVDVAMAMLRGEPVYTDTNSGLLLHSVRLAVVLPLAAAFRLFGANESTAVLWPLLCSVGSVVLVYLVARPLVGAPGGIAAAAIVALNPLEIVYATQLLPDAVLPCVLLLTVWLFLGERYRLAGAALAVAYFARLNAPVILLFLLPYAALARRPARPLLGLAVGFLAVLALGELVYVLNGGVVGFGLTQQLRPLRDVSDFSTPLTADRLTLFSRMLWSAPLFGPWTRAFLAAAGLLLLLRPPRWWVGPLWFAALFLYLELLSQWPLLSLPEKGDRMLSILAGPIALTIAAALARLRWAGVAAAVVLVPVLVLPALRPVPAEKARFWEFRGRFVHQLAADVAALPRGPIWFGNDWRAWVALYLGYPEESLRPGGPARAARLASGSPATLESLRPELSENAARVRDAYVVADPGVPMLRPDAWQEVGGSGNFRFYHVPAALDAGRWVLRLEPELFDAVKPDQDRALAQLTGWGSYSQRMYSRDKAAIGKEAGARMTVGVPSIAPGRYDLRVRVYDYGTGAENRVAVTLNGARGEIAWSAPAAGVHEVSLSLRSETDGGELAVELLARGQPYVIVDAIEIRPAG